MMFYLGITKRYFVFRMDSRLVFFLLLLTYKNWTAMWLSLPKGYILIHFGFVWRCIFEYMLLPSQCGYGQSKYERRKKNEKKHQDKKARASEKEIRKEKENQEKRKIHDKQALKSQAGIDDCLHFGLELPDLIMDKIGRSWFKLRNILEEFHLPVPSLEQFKFTLPNVGEWILLVKGSELFSELLHLLELAITIGWLKRITLHYKGVDLFTTQPLRRSVTATEIMEKALSYCTLVKNKFELFLTTWELRDLFSTPEKNAYDKEYAFLLSQKTCIDLGRKAEVDEETYDRRLAECIETTNSHLLACKQGDRGYYSSRLNKLKELQVSRTLSKKEVIREKPYGMLLFGGSGVGKSAISNALTRYVLSVNGKDSSPSAVVTLNQEDKYQSEFATHHKGVILDDICNTALDRTEGSPATSIIMFLNQVPMAALNANADMKGKVMIEPNVVCGTTNVKDLFSSALSNEPLSINRRFEVTITQTVRPEYRKDGTDMLDNNKIRHMAHMQFPDYALFTVEEPFYGPCTPGSKVGKDKSVKFRPLNFEGRDLIDVDITTLLRFLRVDSANHFAKQAAFVAGQKAFKDMCICEHGLPKQLCKECPLESQFGLELFSEVKSYVLGLEEKICSWIDELLVEWSHTPSGELLLAYSARNSVWEKFQNDKDMILWIAAFMLLCSFPPAVPLFAFLLYVWKLYDGFKTTKDEIRARQCRCTRPSEFISNMSWETKKKLLGLVVSWGLYKVLIALVRKYRQLPSKQAAPAISFPVNMKKYQEEAEFWDTHARERDYKFGDAGVTEASRTIAVKDFDRVVGSRLKIVQKPDGTISNALPIKGNVILIPNHVVPKETEFVTLLNVGGTCYKNLPLSRDNVYRIPSSDLALWYCPGAGSHKDLIKYYPKDIDHGKKLEVHTLFNDQGVFKIFGDMMATRGYVTTTEGGIFSGLNYTFPVDTFGGLCMATMVGSADGIPFIAGHHLAGSGRTGGGGFVTREMLDKGLEALSTRPGILLSHSSMPMETEVMGVSFGPLTCPHEKCPTHKLSSDAKVRIHGGHNLPRASPSSAVVTSVISNAVKEVMDIEKQHAAPPDMDDVRHKDVDMAGKVDTATKFDTKLAQKAYIDYALQMEDLPKSELAQVGKISDDANLAGLDGVLGINAMNFSTSVGFPLKGPKTNYVEKSDRQVDGISCPRDVDSSILEEVARLENELRAGRSINTVFKAALKDEPTKMMKDKVRVFAAANMPFTFLVRKYFLSLAALFQRNKNLTECAVGVVVQSPEWTELFEHIGKFGWERAIAGDYAKFDGRMSPEFMLMAFKILIAIAEKSGNYDEEDLTIMRGIASEISYPTYDYFGTLLQFMGSNPSGHPLTVVINSIVNSLYVRYVYYAIAKEYRWWKVPLFKVVVSLMTYGDDNIMTVKKGYEQFNHTEIAKQFAKVGIKYTMADKDAESVPFIHLSDASFLKHFAVWDDELNLYRSPVEEASIAKMLHTHLKSKVLSMKQSSAEAIQNVALKYFEFGRSIYEVRREQLLEVADKADIRSYVGPIPSYDERLEWYRTKFEM